MQIRKAACMGCTPASGYAADYLEARGWDVSACINQDTRHILLDVPSFGSGRLEHPDALFSRLPADAVIYGGNLEHPGTDKFALVDFLQDPLYLAGNAAITAHCAVEVALPRLQVTLSRLPVLIIGWGRIGKCLAGLLRSMGAEVTVGARKEQDLAMVHALGYRSLATDRILPELSSFRLIYNTAPEMVLDAPKEAYADFCVKIDLASRRGISGEDVFWARGLPGILAPESSGVLMAETFLRLVKEDGI